MVLVIDNYDSFTYNLVQYLLELGEEVIVHRNDEISLDRIREADPQQIVISPGPCTPNEAGISVDCIKEFGTSTPILGVCLGHQSIAQAFGGKIVRANQVMHGRVHLAVKRRQTTLASRMALSATSSPYFQPDPSCRTSTGTPPCFMPVLS